MNWIQLLSSITNATKIISPAHQSLPHDSAYILRSINAAKSIRNLSNDQSSILSNDNMRKLLHARVCLSVDTVWWHTMRLNLWKYASFLEHTVLQSCSDCIPRQNPFYWAYMLEQRLMNHRNQTAQVQTRIKPPLEVIYLLITCSDWNFMYKSVH